MIDIHTHILPGLDDGARDMDDSLEMAAIAAQSGVHALAATSHANTGGFFSEYSVEEYMKRLSDFRRELDREAIPLAVLSGMEIFMKQEQIDRINALYRKSQAEGLTEAEKEEQAMLRKAYVADVKRNLVAQLNNIDMQNPDGTVTNLGEEYGNKKKLS